MKRKHEIRILVNLMVVANGITISLIGYKEFWVNNVYCRFC